MARLGLILAAPVLFVVIFIASLFFVCDGCD
jgi:hypothetical protein